MLGNLLVVCQELGLSLIVGVLKDVLMSDVSCFVLGTGWVLWSVVESVVLRVLPVDKIGDFLVSAMSVIV